MRWDGLRDGEMDTFWTILDNQEKEMIKDHCRPTVEAAGFKAE